MAELQGDNSANSAGTGAPNFPYGANGFDPTTMDNATATRLGLKQYISGTNYNGGASPTISGSNVTGTIRGVFIPYQCQGGEWRLKFNFAITTNAVTVITPAINGIAVKNTANFFQAVAATQTSSARTINQQETNPGTGADIVVISIGGGTSTGFSASGDIELNSKPTWAY